MSNVDDWLSRFPGALPFAHHKTRAIEARRARMSDLLILDVLLLRGGIRSPDLLFPPPDRHTLRTLLHAIDNSVYDILKKDCLVYILLKWAWDTDGWDARYLLDRCIPPQFAALADAYWLLDTGTHLDKAVSILSDARLNRDYVSKILQALALSSDPASFAGGTAHATAALVVRYVRTAKPLLIEPDDIDLYALSLAHHSFMDAWQYQTSFPEASDTRQRLLAKIVGWCLMPTPKQKPLAQLLASPLSPYEQSALYALAIPSATHATTGPPLSSQAISILQDLLCVRAIQSGDYVRAIKLDRQFFSSQAASSGRDAIDRRSIIQDLFATLPPAERTLLEDEIGKVATGVRANPSATFTPKQGVPPARRPPISESSFRASTSSPVPSASVTSASFAARPATVTQPAFSASPFASRPQPISTRQAPPTSKFTAFGSPIPPTTGVSTGRGVITEQGKTLFAAGAPGPGAATKIGPRVSLFETAGSAKKAPNAFFKPPSNGTTLFGVGSALASSTVKSPSQTGTAKQNGKAQGGQDDVSMRSESDVEIIEEGRRDESDAEEAAADEEDDAGDFITHDKSDAADLTIHSRRVDDTMKQGDGAGVELEFSVFGGTRNVVQSGSAPVSGNGHASYASPPRPAVSPAREGNGLNLSVNSSTASRRRAPPGAFHHEEDDEDEDHDEKEDGRDDEDDGVSLTTPFNSPRRSTRTKTLFETPTRPSARSQPRRASKSTSRPSTRTGRTIPGALMDEDNDEHEDADTEMDEQEEDDAIAPLPLRASRRTRSSGYVDASTTASKSKSTTGTKGRAKAQPSEVKTPARRSSRLSTTSASPDYTEVASPTKKGRKNAGPRVSMAGSSTGAVATRSSTRRKR